MATDRDLRQSINISSDIVDDFACTPGGSDGRKATGRELRQSINISSEIAYDFLCSLCGSDGKNIEALFYCVECVERFCSACLCNHNRYAIMKTHQILDKGEMVAMGPQPVYALPTERCPDHHGNLIDTYCPEHRDVCCSTCVSIDHRSCEGITYIPIVAKNITESKEYTDIKPSIRRFQGRLETMKTTMHGEREKLHREKADALKQIADFRKFINNELDRLETDVTNDLQSRHTVIENDIKSHIKCLEDLISTLEENMQKLEKVDNESEIFVQLKLGEKRKSTGESLLRSMDTCSVREALAFMKNKELNDFITNIDMIGTITDSNESSSSPKNINKSNDKDQKIQQVQQATPSVLSDSVMLCGNYYVKLSKDMHICDIIDCCQLQDGTYILSDSANENLKQLNGTFKVVNSCRLNSRPSCVCVTGPMEVVVALHRPGLIQFVSVGDTLQPTRYFPTKMACTGCDYSNECLLVSSISKVAMYNKAGQLLKEIKPGLSQTHIEDRSIKIVYSNVISNRNNTKIYFTNGGRKVEILDSIGKKIASIKDPEIRGAFKICVLDNDDILLCCQYSHNVIRFSSDGRMLGVVLQMKDGLIRPQSICLDRMNSKLMVTCNNSNTIKVIHNVRIH